MRLYPLNSPRTVIDHPKWGHIEADPRDGGFDLSDELSDELHSFHHRGRKLWETEDERSLRLHGDDLARRRDPAALYDAVGDVTGLFKQLGAALGAGTAVPSDAAAEIAELKRLLAEANGTAAAGDSDEPGEDAGEDAADSSEDAAAGDGETDGDTPAKAARRKPAAKSQAA